MRKTVTAQPCAADEVRDRDVWSLECEADCVESADGALPGCFDDGADVSVEGGASFASEAAYDLAVDGAGSRRVLRASLAG